MEPLAVIATGMMTGVGLDAPSSCAAIRCAIDAFEETRFIDKGGEWIIASTVPLDPPLCGRPKLLAMAASVIRECLPALGGAKSSEVVLFVCLAEQTRPGRFAGLDDSLMADLQDELQIQFHRESRVIPGGRVGGVEAIAQAREAIDRGARLGLVVGVDTLVTARTLAAFEERERLQTSINSNGFIPGEAAAAVLFAPAPKDESERAFLCLGVGTARETATIESKEPLRADGMAAALKAAVADAGCTFDDVDYRICDANGEQYVFKEAALAISRTVRKVKPEFDIWHAADCIGEVGAATVPCALAIAEAAARKDYAPGAGVLAHFGNDDGARAALILRHRRAARQEAA